MNAKIAARESLPRSLHVNQNEFMDIVELRNEDALTCDVPENIDLLFEDGAHTFGFTRKIIERFPAKVVVCHDYMHWDCVNTVKHDFDRVFDRPDEIFFEKPSDCGLAIKYIPEQEPLKIPAYLRNVDR